MAAESAWSVCEPCGVPVVDAVAHDRWHRRVAAVVIATAAAVTTRHPSTGEPVITPLPLDEAAEEERAAILRQRSEAAIVTDTEFLALPNPLTNAQVVTQVRALTQQVRALIRLAVRALDSTD